MPQGEQQSPADPELDQLLKFLHDNMDREQTLRALDVLRYAVRLANETGQDFRVVLVDPDGNPISDEQRTELRREIDEEIALEDQFRSQGD